MKRKECWQACVMLALMIVMAASCKKNEDTLSGLNIFDISLPSGWMYQSYADENVLYYAWSPLRTEDDETMENDTINEDLLISREHLPTLDLDRYFTYLVEYLEIDTSYHEIYATDTVINGENAKKLIHLQTFKLPSQTIPGDSIYLQVRPMKFFFFKDEYGYIVDCGMLPYTYPYYKPIFETIMSTFKFKI